MDNQTETLSEVDPALAYQGFAYISYFVLTVIALLIYGVFLKFYLSLYKEHFSEHAFYVLVNQLTVADLFYLLENLLICVPYSFFRRRVFHPGLLHFVLCAGNTVSFFSITICSLLMTFNRLAYFFAPSLGEMLFERPRIYYSSGLIWLYSLGTVVVSTWAECPKDFNHNRYHFLYNCGNKTRDTVQYVMVKGMFLSPAIIGVIMVIAYAALFFKLRFLRKSNGVADSLQSVEQKSRENQERRLLVQGALIGGSLAIENLCFNFIPSIIKSPLGPILMNWSGILNSMLTPCIFMAFNKVIRTELLRKLGIKTAGQGAPTTARVTGISKSRA